MAEDCHFFISQFIYISNIELLKNAVSTQSHGSWFQQRHTAFLIFLAGSAMSHTNPPPTAFRTFELLNVKFYILYDWRKKSPLRYLPTVWKVHVHQSHVPNDGWIGERKAYIPSHDAMYADAASFYHTADAALWDLIILSDDLKKFHPITLM